MSLEVTLAVLLAALMHASWNAMIKSGKDVLMSTACVVLGTGVVALPFLPVVAVPPAAAWPWMMASIATHLAYYWFMVSAYRAGDLSLTYPLMRGVAPLFAALFGAVLLREVPGLLTWVGIGLISLGVFALSYRALGHAPSRRAIGFALANAVVIAIYTVIDGTGARVTGNAGSYVAWLFVLDVIPFTVFMLATRRLAFIEFVQRHPSSVLIGGALSAGAYAIAVWAMTRAPVALVASLRETSVLFATLIGARMLREKLTLRRWVGVLAVVAGVIALKTV